ncbi:CTD small phosphatase-like protein 2 [Raphanus sativus]|uniref:Mitochondrial import inner membrane translocase subunit TIM50 n=1 Tax=Raphanus sativus TaxID=3726 RepID=A0A6J0MQ81_RAPSA|nr:uncharacterized protein LOC108845616 [Raphanus sativus]KAJ4908361.1 CTD small phosphatase-like protein 2 [Raphanus sativus]
MKSLPRRSEIVGVSVSGGKDVKTAIDGKLLKRAEDETLTDHYERGYQVKQKPDALVHSTLELYEDVDFEFPVHFNEEEHTVYVRCRPHLHQFMERVSRVLEIIIFTASQSIYAEQLLNVLDPKRKLFRHRVYRDSCVFFDGNYLKDLSVLGRDFISCYHRRQLPTGIVKNPLSSMPRLLHSLIST